MAGAELEHTSGGGRTAEWGAREGALAHDEREGRQRDWLGDGADRVEAAFGSESGDVAHPVERDGDCADDKIEAVGFGFHGFGITGIHNAVGAEFFEFLGFVHGRSESGDFAAPFIKKLHGEVAQTTDTNDADAICGADPEFDDGAEDRDPAAEEWAGAGGGEGFGKFRSPSPVGADEIGKAAVTSHDGPLACATKVVIATHALGTGHAAFGKPAKTNAIARSEIFNHRSNDLDATDDFVTGHEWVRGKPPLIAEHAEIRVADAAVFHADVHMLGANGREFVGEGLERRCGGVSGVGVDSGHSGIFGCWISG